MPPLSVQLRRARQLLPFRALALWDQGALLLLLLVAFLIGLTFADYGNGFDAQVQDVYGRQVLAWYTSLGHDRSALTYLDLYYYGGLFDTLAALIDQVSPFGHWASRHLLEAVFGLIGLAGAWRLGRDLGGERAGFFALAVLAAMPDYYGMMFINPKDIPFAALMVWSVLALTRLARALPRPSARPIVAVGISLGLTLGARVGGVLLIGYFGLTLLVHALTWTPPGPPLGWTARARHAFLLGLRVLLPATALAWAVMLIFWPWAQVAPFSHPWLAIRHFSDMHNNIDTLFWGHEIGLHYHPALYLPVYMAIKLPDLAVALLAACPVLAIPALRGNGWRGAIAPHRLPLLLAAFFPLIYVLATRPELYDADRHFLFVLPPLAVLAGLAADRLADMAQPRPWSRAAFAILLTLGVAQPAIAMIRLHPYEYAFFNDLVGGTPGARGRFETEYWGTAMAEATTDLGRYVGSHGMAGHPWRVAICGDTTQMGDHPSALLKPTDNWKQADFFIASTRDGCQNRLGGRVVAEVERDGVPFAVVKDMRPIVRLSASPHATAPAHPHARG